jgi:hypothetical protein
MYSGAEEDGLLPEEDALALKKELLESHRREDVRKDIIELKEMTTVRLEKTIVDLQAKLRGGS